MIEAEARAEQAEQAYQDKLAARQEQIDRPRARPSGRRARPDFEPAVLARARRKADRARQVAVKRRAEWDGWEPRANMTDPDSAMMTSPHGWVQGYNAQLAVTDDGIILACRAVNDPTDVNQFIPAMTAACEAVDQINQQTSSHREINMVLADAGYLSEQNLTAPGPDRLIAVGPRRNVAGGDPATGAPRPASVHNKIATDQMAKRLSDPAVEAIYKKRAAMIEHFNAFIKDLRGLRQFARRGLQAVNSELALAVWVTNLTTLYRHLKTA